MLIDFHTHAFPDKLASRAMGSLAPRVGYSPESDGTISGLLSKMELCGVDRSVVCNIATNARQMTNVNNFAIETNRDYGDKLTALGSVHPLAENKSLEIERLHNAGVVGLKLHPDYMGCRIEDEAFDEIFDTAACLHMFIIIHTGFDVYSPHGVMASPDAILTRIARSPRTTLVCAHFGGNMMWNEVYDKLLGKDIYIDTSMGCTEDLDVHMAEKMLLKHDCEKVLFGSDCPWESPARTFSFVDSMSIGDSYKEKIFSENAKRLLNID